MVDEVKKKRGAKNKPSPQVPGQLYGYTLQITRAVAHLLRAHPGQSVSVEFLDDVATTGPASAALEQDKSGLAHNPVADRSIELWKTLHNWVLAIRAGALKQDTKFILYVAQAHHASVIDRIHSVSDQPSAAALVVALRHEYWGSAPTYAQRDRLPEELARFVNGALSASDEVLAQLFVNLVLENGINSPNDDLLSAVREKAIPDESLEDVLNCLLGWTKRAIDKRIEKGLPAVLTWEEFQTQLIAAARKFDRSGTVLTSAAVELRSDDVQTELRSRTYVRQLEIVNGVEDELVGAVNDFLRAAADRTTWSERGDVVEDSFQEFEDALHRAWKSQAKRVEIEKASASEEAQGQLLYANCVCLQLRLQGMDTPPYFIPGSFHSMADSLHVGWHPRYREVIAARAVPATTPGASPRTSPHGTGSDGGKL
ncbi:MAG: hypothetical protein JNM94_14300 [Phycisphaerae bacterium]|nr:hypothetical protein [Phycisphaerae bacterium]